MLVRRAVSVLGRLAQNVLTNQPKRMGTTTITLESRPEEEYWDIRERHITNNYDEYSVILQRGEGVKVYDIDNEEYFDLVSGYSAVNMGHCHPKITQVLMEQAHILHMTSRAFLTDKFCDYAEFMTKTFQYDQLLPTNTGCEGTESAIKIARRWGYMRKGIKTDCAKVLVCDNNFFGRSIAATSASTIPLYYEMFGPFLPNFVWVPYNDVEALEKVFHDEPNLCAFVVEPVQGEAGVIVPDVDYFTCVRKLCDEFKVLLIADEVQTGLGRCGSLLAMDRFGVHADLVVLGKSLGGGVYPVSCVLGDKHIMCVLEPGTHGSTFGGNPLGSAVAQTAVQVLLDERLCENAEVIGCEFRQELECLDEECVLDVRGLGMMNAVEFNPDVVDPYLVVQKMKDFGLLATVTRERVVRIMPPLTLKQEEMLKIMEILHRAVFEAKNRCWV